MPVKSLTLSHTEAEGLLRALDCEAVKQKAGQFYSLVALEKVIDWLKALVLGEGMESP